MSTHPGLCRYCIAIKNLRTAPQVTFELPHTDWILASSSTCPACFVVINFYDTAVRETRTDIAVKWFISERQRLMCNVGLGLPNCYEVLIQTLSLVKAAPAELDGDEWLGTGISKQALSKENVQMARTWIIDCVQSHSRCQQGIPSSPPPLPLRVIDLEIPTNPVLKICNPHPENRPRADYAALSYCWGSGNTLRTTKANLASHVAGIPIEDFPAGLQDAVQTTLALELRYLWIDCLCIIQDDVADWAAHSSHEMQAIYGQSTVTISATSSDDASKPWPSSSAANSPIKLWDGPIPGGDGSTTAPGLATYLIRPVRSWDLNIDAAPLSQRGWALQERLLPRRVLHFGAQQLAFECLTHTATESSHARLALRGAEALLHPFAHVAAATGLHISYAGHARHGQSLLGIKSSLFRGDGAVESLDDVLLQWYGILRLYSRRRLTRALDRMPAIMGIVKLFAERLPDARFVGGIWACDVQRGLCWTVAGEGPLNAGIEPRRAPSWSWLAVDGFTLFPDELVHEDSRVATVEGIDATTESDLSSSGVLRLRTRVVLLGSGEELERWADDHGYKVFWDAGAEDGDLAVAFVAKLWHGVDDNMAIMPNYSVFFMVLRRVAGDASGWERVGITKNPNPWRGNVADGKVGSISIL
ncbi:hypothetical protein MCOR31_011513 [Pyricularia oryzae]|nr:hypothetical protein MCOR31_011513 [Pyricularia oryzae]